jgi:hypothetical protein
MVDELWGVGGLLGIFETYFLLTNFFKKNVVYTEEGED